MHFRIDIFMWESIHSIQRQYRKYQYLRIDPPIHNFHHQLFMLIYNITDKGLYE